MVSLPALLIMSLLALTTALGQILLKKGVSRRAFPKDLSTLFVFLGDPRILGGLALALLGPVLYLKALTFLSLGELYGLNGLSLLAVFLLARVVLKERGNRFHHAGLALILAGVLVWSGGWGG